jgi:hypothetical protein
MESAGNWSDTVVSWSEFVIFHVLPTAVSQIYDWIREWQILAAAALVVIFFHVWSRAILRAARRVAKETVQTETRAFGASLNLLRRQIEQKTEPSRPPAEAIRPAAVQNAESLRAQPLPPPPRDAQAAIEQLRQAIRLALGTIPLSDEPLSPEGTRLYRAAIGALADSSFSGAEASDEVSGKIRSELAELEQSFPPQSCRQAWQSLVKVNALAREFHEPAQPSVVASSIP